MALMWHHLHRRYAVQFSTPQQRPSNCVQARPLTCTLDNCCLLQVQQLLNTIVTDTEIAEMELQVCLIECTFVSQLQDAHRASVF
jgi:hypothetical protein